MVRIEVMTKNELWAALASAWVMGMAVGYVLHIMVGLR